MRQKVDRSMVVVVIDWKAQIDGKVRTGSKQARGTHKLEHTDRWASQDSKQVRGSHHLESTDGWASQDREQANEQGGLTNQKAQMGVQVRTWSKCYHR